MSKIANVTASNGVNYNVRLVEKGDRHGRNMCLVHEKDRPMVVFYDTESQFDYDFVGDPEDAKKAGAMCLGQQASSYYVETLLENIATTGGIDLCGHVPRWKIDGNAVRKAFQELGLWSPPVRPMGVLIEKYVSAGDDDLPEKERLRLLADRILDDVGNFYHPPTEPFYVRASDAALSADLKDFFFRLLGPMRAIQVAYPFIDVAHLIQSFEKHAGCEAGARPDTLERGRESPEKVKPVKVVVVYDSQDPDTEPEVWVPGRLAAYYESLPLNKSQELGGRYPNTDPADIELLEAGTNAAFPGYRKI